MKKSVSKVIRAGLVGLALLGGMGAAGADSPPTAAPNAVPAKPKRLSAGTREPKERAAKIYKSGRLSKKMRELTDEYAEAAPVDDHPFGASPASAGNPDDAGATSGTLATDIGGNYSTAPWSITAGTGTYPGGGGTAEFDAVTNFSVALPGTTTITLDVTPTLAGITFNSPFNYTLAASGSNTLVLSPAGGTITATETPASTPSLFSFGDAISAPITGGVIAGSGTTGLTITGGGSVSLTGVNTYTGGTLVNDGSTLVLSTAKDTALGASGTGNDVTLDNGNLLVYSSTASTVLTTARNFTLGPGGGNFELFNGLTINGVVSGTGALNYTAEQTAGSLTLTAANTYTGPTNTNGTLS